MLALVMGVVLSMCASAWAATYYFYKLGDVLTAGNLYEVEEGASVTVSFDVTVYITTGSTNVESQTLESATDPLESGTYYKNANILNWAVGTSDTFTPSSMTIKSKTDTGPGHEIDSSLFSKPGYALTMNDFTLTDGRGAFHYIITVVGTTTDVDDATLPISVSLYRASDGTAVTSYTAETELEETASAGSESTSIVVTERSQEEYESDSNDPRDPSSSKWNGLPPTFPNTISGDYGKAKPKLGKIEKTALSFASGTAKDLNIPITGPVTEVDVYVAAKDAIKLGWLAKGANTNIQLNQDNIKSYDIPFRVTSYDFATSVSGSSTKEIQKAWKSAENSLTLAFNGGKYAMKGFPLTISMSNSNTSSKPVTKTIKLDVTPNTVLPEWVHNVTSREITTEEETATEWGDATPVGHYTSTGDALQYDSDDDDEDDTDETPEHMGYEGTVLLGGTFTVDDTLYILSTDNKVYLAGLVVDYYYHDLDVAETYTKKDKPEISAVVYPSEESAGDLSGTFTVSADGPYTITVKPSEDDKLKKFFADGYDLTITQPEFDFLGNVTTPGFVYICGTPTNTAKESKLALTLTATNPFTKKKGALKVTASGKLAPYFEKLNDDGYVTTKRVEAGKVPSVKFKAKGSKNIAYKLGNYYFDEDDKTIKAEDEDYNTELEEKLAALKLSFDAKKGAVVLLSKSDKNTLPTLNSDGDAFQSLDIVVTAYNNVGAAQAYASVAITGAKPKISTKTITYTAGAEAYDDQYLTAKVGKADAGADTAGANVRFYPATDADAKVLSDLGIELLHYDELTTVVSGEATISDDATLKAGDTAPENWTSRVVSVTDSEGEAVLSDSYSSVVNSSRVVKTGYTIVIYSGDKTVASGDVEVVSADATLKNKGILRVTDPSKVTNTDSKGKDQKKNVNLIIENLGATNKGKFTIVVKAGSTTTTTSALPGSNKSAPEAAGSSAATKTNGTASITYNGAAPEADSEAEATEPVTIGAPRTAADLTAGQQAFLAAKGLKVIAVLPEISANVEGQHEFPVTLDEDAPEGAKMVYVPFPQNAEETDDDKIADFYGADGQTIEEVPADKLRLP